MPTPSLTGTPFAENIGNTGPSSGSITPSGVNRMGWVWFMVDGNPPASVTWGGASMTLVESANAFIQVYLYVTDAEVPATSATINWSTDGFTAALVAAFATQDTDTTSPVAHSANAAGVDNITVTSAVGQLPVACIADYSSGPVAPVAPATRIVYGSNGNYQIDGAYDTGAASVNIAFENVNTGFASLAAVSIQGAAGGGGSPWYAFAQQREKVKRTWNKHGVIFTPSYAYGKAV